jgi:hypothetical protein
MMKSRNMVQGCGLGSFGTGQGPVTGFCEHGNELMRDCAPWGLVYVHAYYSSCPI